MNRYVNVNASLSIFRQKRSRLTKIDVTAMSVITMQANYEYLEFSVI